MKLQPLLFAIVMASCNLSASIITYDASLNGSNESPSNGSPATGLAEVTVDDSLNTMAVSITFVGLAGPATASHIQCCTAAAFTGTAGVAASFPTFPSLTSGTFTLTYDLTSLATYNPAFITASGGTAADAEATLLAGLAGELAYVNIHDSIYPGGEIRGFLAPAVPEPATFGLTGLALVGLLALRSRIAA